MDKRALDIDYKNAESQYMEANSKYNSLQNELYGKTFCGQNLNKPGTIVQLENDKVYLIGNFDVSDEYPEDFEKFKIKKYAILDEVVGLLCKN